MFNNELYPSVRAYASLLGHVSGIIKSDCTTPDVKIRLINASIRSMEIAQESSNEELNGVYRKWIKEHESIIEEIVNNSH